jgi:hypothetical protein
MGASAFSYGPDLHDLPFTAATAEGGPASVYGYGLDAGGSITVGGATASAKPADQGSVYTPGPAFRLNYTVPAGVAGTADVVLQTADGSRTYPRAFRYYPATQKYSLPGLALLMGIYDPGRRLVYYIEADKVDVFSTASRTWLSPIQLPQVSVARKMRFAALSPKADILAVTDAGNETLLVIDLASRSVTRELSLHVANETTAYIGFPVAFASDTDVITFAQGEAQRTDIVSGNIIWQKPLTEDPYVATFTRLVLDQSARFAFFNGYFYDFLDAQLFLHPWGCGIPASDLAFGSDGRVAQGEFLLDPSFKVVNQTYESDAEYFTIAGSPLALDGERFGRVWDPSGTYIIQPHIFGFDLIDFKTGRTRERVSTWQHHGGRVRPLWKIATASIKPLFNKVRSISGRDT